MKRKTNIQTKCTRRERERQGNEGEERRRNERRYQRIEVRKSKINKENMEM